MPSDQLCAPAHHARDGKHADHADGARSARRDRDQAAAAPRLPLDRLRGAPPLEGACHKARRPAKSMGPFPSWSVRRGRLANIPGFGPRGGDIADRPQAQYHSTQRRSNPKRCTRLCQDVESNFLTPAAPRAARRAPRRRRRTTCRCASGTPTPPASGRWTTRRCLRTWRRRSRVRPRGSTPRCSGSFAQGVGVGAAHCAALLSIAVLIDFRAHSHCWRGTCRAYSALV